MFSCNILILSIYISWSLFHQLIFLLFFFPLGLQILSLLFTYLVKSAHDFKSVNGRHSLDLYVGKVKFVNCKVIALKKKNRCSSILIFLKRFFVAITVLTFLFYSYFVVLANNEDKLFSKSHTLQFSFPGNVLVFSIHFCLYIFRFNNYFFVFGKL